MVIIIMIIKVVVIKRMISRRPLCHLGTHSIVCLKKFETDQCEQTKQTPLDRQTR